MRHIPEAELHAYLDQALSRSQCVEIEQHLADCAACQSARDEIAALRDRTTALLARVAPPESVAPPFEVLVSRTAAQRSARRRRIQRWAWAASVAGGVGLGWAAADVFRPAGPGHDVVPPAVATASSENRDSTRQDPLPVTDSAALVARHESRAKSRGPSRAARQSATQARIAETRPVIPVHHDSVLAVIPAPLIAPSSASGPADSADRAGDLLYKGVWDTMSWDGAQAAAGGQAPPHVDGLPVVQVQVQKGEAGTRPMMVVAQQLSSGEVIRTIEGPAGDVSRLLGRRVMTDPDQPTPSDSGGQRATDRTMALQRGDRMLVITGVVPPDSLRAMMNRVNAELKNSGNPASQGNVPAPVQPQP